MAIKLGEMLIEAGKLTPSQLEETLKSQVIFGGRLGTNLIEMGYLEEDDLTQFLSKKMGFPFATPEQLMSVPLEIVKLIPKEIAEKHKVIPLSRDKKRLTLAMLDPADLSVIDAISFMTGFYIIPVIAPELRMVQALEKYYDIRRDVRYIQIAGSSRGRQRMEEAGTRDAAEPDLIDFSRHDGEQVKPYAGTGWERQGMSTPQEMATRGVEEPDLIDFGQQQESEEIFEALEEVESAAEPVVVEPVRIEPVRVEPARVEPVKVEPVKVDPVKVEPVKVEPVIHTIDSVSEQLAEAHDREEIADTIVAFLGQGFDRVALFMVRGANANGWRAVRDKKAIPDIENLQIPLDGPSVLKVVTDGKSFYVGPIPDTPGNARMLAGIGGGTPSSALLIPLMMMGRVVTIVYVDGGNEPVANRLTDLQKLIGKAAMAFEILILKNKILMS